MVKESQYLDSALICKDINKIIIKDDSRIFHAMMAMEAGKKHGLPAGLSIVLDKQLRLVGVITDGDIRRALLEGLDRDSPVLDVMRSNPVVVSEHIPDENVLEEINSQIRTKKRNIKYAICVNEAKQVIGLIDVEKMLLSKSWQWDTIGVIGLGYVGLTLSVTLAEVGFKVVCWDQQEDIRKSLSKGESHIFEIGIESLLKMQLDKGRLKIASSYEDLSKCKVFFICVNTPVKKALPDLSYLKQAVVDLGDVLKPGDLVILRSTVPVGVSRDVVARSIEDHTNYKIGRDIGISFAPERTVEGNALKELRILPQIVSGIDSWCTEATEKIFSRFCHTIVRTDSLEEAEMIKLINNTFRDISFAFANEVAMMCEAHNLNANKVIEACNSGYPRNPVSLPSPGVGGPCLTKDPYIFANINDKDDMPSLAKTGRIINEKTPANIAVRIMNALKRCDKTLADCSVFILGFAFKGDPETNDLRNSPTIDLVKVLKKNIHHIFGYDPIVPKKAIEEIGVQWKDIDEGFTGADAVLFVNNNHRFTELNIYQLIEKMSRPAVFFDGWNLFDSEEIEQFSEIHYVGLGYLSPLSDI